MIFLRSLCTSVSQHPPVSPFFGGRFLHSLLFFSGQGRKKTAEPVSGFCRVLKRVGKGVHQNVESPDRGRDHRDTVSDADRRWPKGYIRSQENISVHFGTGSLQSHEAQRQTGPGSPASCRRQTRHARDYRSRASCSSFPPDSPGSPRAAAHPQPSSAKYVVVSTGCITLMAITIRYPAIASSAQMHAGFSFLVSCISLP